MSPNVVAGQAPIPQRLANGRWLLAMLAIVAAGVAGRLVFPTNSDVSWLIDAAGRLLAGERLYVDIMEVDPPASILLYLPPVAVARWLGLRPEGVTDAMMGLGAWASLALTLRIMRRDDLPPGFVAPWITVAAACLLVLPGFIFAEREHIAVMALLPGLATLAVRHAGAVPSRRQAMLAGLGLGLVVIIKPMLALGLIGPVAVLAARRWRRLAASSELWIGAVLAGLYGWVVVRSVPAFTERMLPLALAVYVPSRIPFAFLVRTKPGMLWLGSLIVLALHAQRGAVGALAVMLASASVGLQGAVLLQGKGFPYHSYPAIVCAILALSAGLLHQRARRRTAPPRTNRPAGLAWAASATFVAGFAAVAFAFFQTIFDPFGYAPGLDRAIQALGPRPHLLVISELFDLGQPFARQLGAVWSGSAPSTWVTADVSDLVAQGAAGAPLGVYVEAEQRMYADDIARKRPDAVLVDGPAWQAWIDGSPALTAAMAAYRPSGPPFGPVVMWVRRNGARVQP